MGTLHIYKEIKGQSAQIRIHVSLKQVLVGGRARLLFSGAKTESSKFKEWICNESSNGCEVECEADLRHMELPLCSGISFQLFLHHSNRCLLQINISYITAF
jgi:hypothetical protein